jgi:hypothetical protein
MIRQLLTMAEVPHLGTWTHRGSRFRSGRHFFGESYFVVAGVVIRILVLLVGAVVVRLLAERVGGAQRAGEKFRPT